MASRICLSFNSKSPFSPWKWFSLLFRVTVEHIDLHLDPRTQRRWSSSIVLSKSSSVHTIVPKISYAKDDSVVQPLDYFMNHHQDNPLFSLWFGQKTMGPDHFGSISLTIIYDCIGVFVGGVCWGLSPLAIVVLFSINIILILLREIKKQNNKKQIFLFFYFFWYF